MRGRDGTVTGDEEAVFRMEEKVYNGVEEIS